MQKALAALAISAVVLPALTTALSAADKTVATVAMTTTEGMSAGTVRFEATPNGVLIIADLKNLSPGEHGFHIHETGACKPDFSAAGDHFAPDGHEHGYANAKGSHAGDMPNIFVADDGTAKFHGFNSRITLDGDEASIFDEDGAALIIHADEDTYLSEAKAGSRVACGVIEKR